MSGSLEMRPGSDRPPRHNAILIDRPPLAVNSFRVDQNELSGRPYDEYGRPIQLTLGQRLKKFLGPIGAAFFVLLKYLKFVVPFLKTGGSMLFMIWIYARAGGWPFAVGFVLLIFVHECGHLLVAKRLGMKVSAPVFIPFIGALIMLKHQPRNAWEEAEIGIGGPILGSVGAAICYGIYLVTGNPLFRGLAYSGFLINLFNLTPIGFLDGGRIVSALSPWLWLVGFIIMGLLLFLHFNFLLILILVVSLPRLFSLFRTRSETERLYYQVTTGQRWTMSALYFGLIGLLVMGMAATAYDPDMQ